MFTLGKRTSNIQKIGWNLENPLRHPHHEKYKCMLQAATMRHKVSPGCGAFVEESEEEGEKDLKASNPCDREPCRHGECSTKSTHPGYHCKCHPGFAGKLCDIRGGYK